MKEVMDNFNKQTQQRFHEYDERMQSKRMQCKDRCDKEIQKIILKDKLEKELTEKFSALHTDIHSDAIPTCICEKSMADKMEKDCLRCTYGLGTLAPTVGLIGSVAVHVWKPKALAAAIAAALETNAATIASAAQAAGIKAGKEVAIESLKLLGVEEFWTGMSNYILEMSHYNGVANLMAVIYPKKVAACKQATEQFFENMCQSFDKRLGILNAEGKYADLPKDAVPNALNEIVSNAETSAKAAEAAKSAKLTAEIAEQQTAAINATYTSWQIAITASVIAIVVIVLIMVIIYLVLRYRRKKKMKKKLQYIKLLEE
ncbi:hypothetical protein PFMALIP_06254 [Plasmodium falciparum MaliPS096_E11]|uniref:Surface antigen n=1 Tax=Plasmodium falciparum MaliPS096_E11 TaxID=1036727 RepID=A0A024WFP4_PLAFA|nr:hypothetical protein PFMALIP_06254 [Plasmodium falciparum MaliPS096_E11]